MTGRTAIAQPAPLLRLVPWLVAGILIEDRFPSDGGALPLVLAVIAVACMHRWPTVQSMGIGLCFMLSGMLLTRREHRQLDFTADSQFRTMEAVVISEITQKPKTVAMDLLLTGSGRRVKAFVHKDTNSLRLKPGDGLVIRTQTEQAGKSSASTRFNYRRFLQANGFVGSCYVGSRHWQRHTVPLGKLRPMERLRLRALCWRHSLLSRYETLTNGKDGIYGVLAAMTLGDKSALTRELRDTYSQTGASHILALSGLHMGILFGLLSTLTFLLRHSLAARLLTITLFWGFALLTGLSPSIVRSAFMLSVATVFSLRGSRGISVNALCLAAMVILLLHPYALFDVGFQLSFLAVFSILVLMPLLDSFWPEDFLFRHRTVKMLWSLVSVSIAAQAGTAPLVAYHFGQLPLYFILTSLIVIPVTYAVLSLSLLFLIIPMAPLGHAVSWLVNALNTTLTAMSAWPYASVNGLQPSALQTAMAYLLIIMLFHICIRLPRFRMSG